MSHQTGIKGKTLEYFFNVSFLKKKKYHFYAFMYIFPANEELKKFFAKSKLGKIRVFKISIGNGKLVRLVPFLVLH
jgi:hypothetical protein